MANKIIIIICYYWFNKYIKQIETKNSHPKIMCIFLHTLTSFWKYSYVFAYTKLFHPYSGLDYFGFSGYGTCFSTNETIFAIFLKWFMIVQDLFYNQAISESGELGLISHSILRGKFNVIKGMQILL